MDGTLTKASHIKIFGRFRNNRKGYAGIIAAIFLVLIAIFLFYNVFMFQLSGNTILQDSSSQANQMLIAQNTEQLSFTTPTYTFPDQNHVTITVNITDISPVSIKIVSIWAKDTAVNSNPNWGENSSATFVFPTGQTVTVASEINIPGILGSDPTCASLISWVVTASGRSFSITASGSGSGSGGGGGGGGGNNAPFGLDQYNYGQDTVTGDTMSISITTKYAYDVLYLAWIGGSSGQTINFVSTSGSSPNTSPWIQRALISPDGAYWVSTWYAISTTAGTYTITITMSNTLANCAAILFAVGGENTTAPFDGNARTNSGLNGPPAAYQITTSNANDLIVGAMGAQANCQALEPQYGYENIIATQIVGTSRFISTEDTLVTTKQTNLNVGYGWNSNNKGNWGIVLDAIMKGS